MSDLPSMIILGTRLSIAFETVKSLLRQIQEIENDTQTPAIQKLSEIKKIREQLDKVGMEIDNLKQELTLLKTYRVN